MVLGLSPVAITTSSVLDWRRRNSLNIQKNNNLQWVCPKCIIYKCASCVKVIGKRQDSILCNLCKNRVHRKCSILEKCEFEKIGQSEDPWFCLGCRKGNLPFLTLDTQKFSKLFDISKTARNKDNQGVQWCRVCGKKKYHARNVIKCIRCKHIIHKNCPKIQIPHNFVCATCLTETFPITQTENYELEKLSFNSNFTCSCLLSSPE